MDLRRMAVTAGMSLALVFPAGAQSAEIALSLGDAVRLANRNNRAIQMQEREVEAAGARVKAARSGFFPNVSAQGGYTRSGATLQVPSLAGAQPKKDTGVFTGYRDDNSARLSVSQPVFKGGGLTAELRQAQVSLDIAKATLRAQKQDVLFETRRLYYGLLLAQETEAISRDLLDQARRHADEVGRRFGQGQASRFDALQSEVQVSKLSPAVINAGNQVQLIAAQLKRLLGIPQKKEIRLSGRLEYAAVRVDEEEFLKQAYLERPEMELRSLGVDLAAWQEKTAAASGLPQISADASYLFRSNDVSDMFNKRHSSWNAGITVSVPVFEGFLTQARVEEARAKYARASLARQDIAEQIAVEIRQAGLDLARAAAVISSQKDAVELARDALRIAEVRFANAQGTNLDVLDAQVSLNQIRVTLSQAVYEYLMALAFLDRSIGKGPEEG